MKKQNIFMILLFLSCYNFTQIDVKATDKYIENARKAWNVPGMSVAIVKDGEVVLSKGYGVQEIGDKNKVDEYTQFAIASNTKAFVSSAISRLVDEGKIS